MKTKIAIATALLFFAGVLHATPPKAKAERKQDHPVSDTGKKTGEECSTSAECRHHNRCVKQGEKKVCVAPALRDLPKT